MIRNCFAFFVMILFALSSIIFAQNIEGFGEKESNISFTNQRSIPCATPDPTVEQIIQSKVEVDRWLSQNSFRDRDQVIIYVIWHAIHASDNTGNISDSRIAGQIEAMNLAFSNNNTNISFVLDSINRVENDAWFTGWSPDTEEYVIGVF